MKDCPTCHTRRPKSDFHRNRSRPDGLHGECVYCSRERQAGYRLARRKART